jgi:small-conductance mechanosensitive channel/CRP-like cAMP-binding protein
MMSILEALSKNLKLLSTDVFPEMVIVLSIAGPVFLLFLYFTHKTRDLVRKVRFTWYFQVLLIFLITLSIKPIFLSIGIINKVLVGKASLTLFLFTSAHVLNHAIILFLWEGAFVRKYEKSPPGILVGLLSVSLYLIAIYFVMSLVFNQPMTGLLVSSSIMAGVIGLAMQSSLSDLVAGVSISIERPFTIGDWIELDDGTLGEVTEINWRATHVLSWHNSLYVLPNARISNARVHNFNRPVPTYGHWFYVHIPSTVDPTLVRRVLLEGCIDSPKVLDDPPPIIRVSEASASYKYLIFIHFENYQGHFAGMDDLLMNIWVKCYKYGIVPSAVTSEMIIRRGVAEEIPEPSPEGLLRQVEIFKDLGEQHIKLVLSRLNVVSLKHDEKIVGQGDAGSSLYILSSGMVRIMIENDGSEAFEVAKLVTGQYFGEMSLLTNEPRSASVYAHTDCQFLEIKADAMRLIFDEDPSLMDMMAKIVSQRKLSNKELEESLSKEDLASKISKIAENILLKIKSTFTQNS